MLQLQTRPCRSARARVAVTVLSTPGKLVPGLAGVTCPSAHVTGTQMFSEGPSRWIPCLGWVSLL